MENIFDGTFGKIAPGMCRLTIQGKVAVKTASGYRTYNEKNGNLTNCGEFTLGIADNFFFVIPVSKVKTGDIILVRNAQGNRTPRCVTGTENNRIRAINYETSVEEIILPERHIFLGNTYFYGKVVSLLGGDLFKGKKGAGKIMQYMMLSQIMGGANAPAGGGALTSSGYGGTADCGRGAAGGFNSVNGMLPLLLMGSGNVDDLFGGLFEEEEEEENEAVD